ncbi:uncharacterized protein BDV14DRAFT_166486 [Aspergillus stella-maris]|uniref:uncharacterized protein n=1 Tax=Aspergillus stella-maris TaxID=1810926 RepID=UPI003CCD8549
MRKERCMILSMRKAQTSMGTSGERAMEVVGRYLGKERWMQLRKERLLSVEFREGAIDYAGLVDVECALSTWSCCPGPVVDLLDTLALGLYDRRPGLKVYKSKSW